MFAKSKLEKALSKKRKNELEPVVNPRKVFRRQFSGNNVDLCIFCGADGNEELHQVTTFAVDENVRKMATDMEDLNLLSKVSGPDMIASEAKYHRKRMRSFKNRYRSWIQKQENKDTNEQGQMAEALAFSELVSFMEMSAENGVTLFKLSELHHLYEHRLEDLTIAKRVNKTRLKEKLLAHFGEDTVYSGIVVQLRR